MAATVPRCEKKRAKVVAKSTMLSILWHGLPLPVREGSQEAPQLATDGHTWRDKCGLQVTTTCLFSHTLPFSLQNWEIFRAPRGPLGRELLD